MTDAEQITHALHRLDRRRRRLSILRQSADGLMIFGLWLGTAAALDAYFAIGSRTRLVLAILLGTGAVLLLIRMAVVLFSRPSGLLELARLAEMNDAAWDERLMTTVTQMTLPPERRASASLNYALQSTVANDILARPPAGKLPLSRLRRSILRAALVGGIWLLAASLPGVPMATLVGRQLLPLAAIAPVSGVRIELSPTPPAIAQGDSITIDATLVGGNVPAVLEVGPTLDELRPVAMEPSFGQTYTVTLLSPQRDMVYRVRAGSARTPPVFVRVQRRPGMSGMAAEIQLPDGRSMAWSPEAGMELALPLGGRVNLRFQTTEPLRSAVCRSKQGAVVAASGESGRRSWRAELPVTADADWDIELIGETGLSATAPAIKIRAER